MIPGEIILNGGDIACNVGRKTVKLSVKNTGDRPIQVGSHFHFFESNKFLDFERDKAIGMRLNIPAGTAVRFEPGEQMQVVLVSMGGSGNIFGFNNLTDGDVKLETVKKAAKTKAKNLGFKGTK